MSLLPNQTKKVFEVTVHMPKDKYFLALHYKIRRAIEKEIKHTSVSIKELELCPECGAKIDDEDHGDCDTCHVENICGDCVTKHFKQGHQATLRTPKRLQ